MNYLKFISLVRQKSSFVLALLILVPFFFVACSDDPSSLGSDLLNQDNIIVSKLDSFTDTLAQKFEPHQAKLSLGSSEVLLVGKDANVESQILLAFYFSVSSKYLADLDSNLTFVSADISLTRTYFFGDTLQSFNVGIHQVTSSWNSLFTIDSLPKLSYNSSSVMLSQSNTGSAYTFSVDPNLAKDWFKAAKDTSLGKNYGLLLKPNGTCRFTGFAASTSYTDVPTIKIVVKKSSTYETYQDTLTYNGSVDVHLIQGSFPEASNKTLTIQSGTGVQGKLWFDLSNLPADAVVNTAKLTLNIDTLNIKVGSSYTDGLLAYQIADSTTDSTNSQFVVSLARSGNTYSGDVARIINNAVITKNNYGMLIMPYYQIKGIENFALFNSNALNGELKPRLTITYSQKKK
ncbi:MAG: hypothetical protein WC209_07115 [Ignavibacteriaceae bacterium]